MKKLVLLILGFILGALAMYFYCQKDGGLEGMEPDDPKGLITPAEIKALTHAYNPRYDSITNQFFRGVQGGDNRSSWYDLEDLRNYLIIAENQAKDLNYKMDGVRIYLGAHPTQGNIPGYTTMLFVPTGQPITTSEGKMFNFALQTGGGGDIPGGLGLDKGTEGVPPGANYPQ
ncbi:hypothetical protein [Psychroserpens sp. SPM9]|uniref:hypothetical protein n=1 Tax=Psychroserpens sp. SPM9 TaxID=2975598 RepID=UPI0021A6317D|nr:hypothetical protein [Psychroserpens sp. SPM9]MDG5491818.1 hypothetical protein [Psychroserpens sp. SPM9]